MTINDIQSEVRATGSHWFDPSTMRFFGTRICGGVYGNEAGTKFYFVSSEKPPHGARNYTVRVYDRETKQIDNASERGEFTSRSGAIAAAKRRAGKNCTIDNDGLCPITDAEQFHADCKRHGNPKATRVDCDDLRRLAQEHQRIQINRCNIQNYESLVFDSEGEPIGRLKRNRERIGRLAKAVGAKSVLFSGDPRGCTVKLIWTNGETNDFGREGWCIPIPD